VFGGPLDNLTTVSMSMQASCFLLFATVGKNSCGDGRIAIGEMQIMPHMKYRFFGGNATKQGIKAQPFPAAQKGCWNGNIYPSSRTVATGDFMNTTIQI
jgi:hypothetical protein